MNAVFGISDELMDILVEINVQLGRHRDLLAIKQSEETSKPIRFSYVEVDRCSLIIQDCLAFMKMKREESGRINTSQKTVHWVERKIPVGHVLGITPFSSPYSSFIQKFINAFIHGNKFTLKPSEYAMKRSNRINENSVNQQICA